MSEIEPGDPIWYWPGARVGYGYPGVALSGVIPASVNNFGTDVVRIQRFDGGTDYIATTHLDQLPS